MIFTSMCATTLDDTSKNHECLFVGVLYPVETGVDKGDEVSNFTRARKPRGFCVTNGELSDSHQHPFK